MCHGFGRRGLVAVEAVEDEGIHPDRGMKTGVVSTAALVVAICSAAIALGSLIYALIYARAIREHLDSNGAKFG
jgi:hypothetical protein